MPAIKSLADYLTATLSTFEKNRYDSVGLAQKYPDLELVKQQIVGGRMVERTAADYETVVEVDSPSSYEKTYVNHPLEPTTNKLVKRLKSTMAEVRVSTTFNEKEKAFKGKSGEQIVDEVQMRLTKMDREFLEGEEESFLTFPASPSTEAVPSLIGLTAAITAKSGQSSGPANFDPNGGDDPFSTGYGGITKAVEPKIPNATGVFAKISQDDFFDTISKFLHRVKTKAVVAHPAFTSDAVKRILYTQEPIQRAVERYLASRNMLATIDAGAYRGAALYRNIPITIWHAMSSPDSSVRPTTGTCLLVDWETIHYIVHADINRKMHGPEKYPHIPGQHVVAMEHSRLLHCARRDRNLRLTTATADLQPDSV